MLAYLAFMIPAMLFGLWANWRLRSTMAQAQAVPAGMSGAAAARKILDSFELHNVGIEMTHGYLTDHYDPTAKVLRLSEEIYHGSTAAAVGVAAHEAGHAIQDAKNYSPLVLRNAVVPVAGFGSGIGIWVIIFGALFAIPALMLVGIALFSAVVAFQLINLPVEYDASARAKEHLAYLGIVNPEQGEAVDRALNAAALTYVAATLSSILTLMYYIMVYAGISRD